MSSNELTQDANEAAQMGPSTAAPTLSVRGTPRWIWAWTFPLVIILMLYLARRVLGPFVIAGMLAYIFSMVVDSIQDRLRWPRWTIVGLMYLLVLGSIGLGLYFGSEALYLQTRQFVSGGPTIVESALQKLMGSQTYTFGGQTVDAHSLAERVNEGLASFSIGGDALHLASEIVVRLLDTILVIIVSFYLLIDGKRLGAYILKFVPEGYRSRTGYIAGRIHTVLGAYLRGQLLLIGIMSLVSFLILQFVFQVPYALPLGIMTGFLEILPLIGPAIATAIAGSVALSAHGVGSAVGVLIVYVILRQLEDQLVMPFVVGRAVELHPVVTIFAVLAGGAMAGVLGMLLAVPTAAAIKIILDFLYPTDPTTALKQARPGIKKAAREAEERGEAPAPSAIPSAEPGQSSASTASPR